MAEVCSFRIKNQRVKISQVFMRSVRFGCCRCATFCCKLGGPQLTERDIVRLEETGVKRELFVEGRSLRNKPNGECIFLRRDLGSSSYTCAVYEHRPVLCRIYPFNLKIDRNDEWVLTLLPCKGLSTSKGESVDRMFIEKHLKPLLPQIRTLYEEKESLGGGSDSKS